MITYLDNASTTHPKPESVHAFVDRFMRESGVGIFHGEHRLSRAAVRMVRETRESVLRLTGGKDPNRVVFTRGATEALNLALKGLLAQGDSVVTTTIEHAAVERPLARLATTLGVRVRRVSPGPDGIVAPSSIDAAIDGHTRLVVLTHASNVTGAIQPIEEVAAVCARRGVRVLVDASQTVGRATLDAAAAGIHAVAFSGHKRCFGHAGIGVLWLAQGVDPAGLIEGEGEVSARDLAMVPPLPGRLEAGTLDVAAVASLRAGIDAVLAAGLDKVRAHEDSLIEMFVGHAQGVDGLRLHLPAAAARVGLVNFSLHGFEPADLASALDDSYDIAVRAGYHGSPGAHESLGTLERGTVRMSVSLLTTDRDVGHLIEALHSLSLLA